jgi:uncharacterized protein YbjT (DUF2867 family)
MDQHKIAVIGATGMLGRPVTQALTDAEFSLVILSREPERAQEVFPRTHILKADMEDYNSLRRALKGVHTVYVSLNIEEDERSGDFHAEGEGMKYLIRAARKEGIQRIALLSSLVHRYNGMDGFHWWLFDVKKEAIELLKESGIPYIIFYPSSFMENFVFHQRQGNKLVWIGESKHPMYYISAIDYANQVTKALEQAKEGESYEYVVQGPEAFTADQAMQTFIQASPEKLEAKKYGMGMSKLLGTFSHKLRYASRIMDALNNYPEKFEAEETWKELEKPEITLGRFAAEIAPKLANRQ